MCNTNLFTVLTILLFVFACEVDPKLNDLELAAETSDTTGTSELEIIDPDDELVCSSGICCGFQRDGSSGYTTWGDCEASTKEDCDAHYLDCGSQCYTGAEWCAIPPSNGYNTCCS